ncbi:unnamed protein product [Prunus armeniaca]|uniref:Uncharacterized protein n=1 Tax=Prunus armeniaca TaxID=36596 RepID=A0A6J5WHA8_PRUAR|nr:unnamed protein product [Prunus armeniaca]CAB4300909.1 unnamed protein product [Prunus armeniaca]
MGMLESDIEGPDTLLPWGFCFRTHPKASCLSLLPKAPVSAHFPPPEKPPRKLFQFQVRSVAAPAEAVAGFGDTVLGLRESIYYLLGGKSLAVKFANIGHPTP